MRVVAINHDVADYQRWKGVFDTLTPVSQGAKFHRVNRNVADPNNITVVAGFETQAAAEAFLADPALEAAMERAGVVSAPRIEIFEELEHLTA